MTQAQRETSQRTLTVKAGHYWQRSVLEIGTCQPHEDGHNIFLAE